MAKKKKEWVRAKKVTKLPKRQAIGQLSEATEAILAELKKYKSGATVAFDYAKPNLAKNRAESLQKLAKKAQGGVKRAFRRAEKEKGKPVYRVYVTKA